MNTQESPFVPICTQVAWSYAKLRLCSIEETNQFIMDLVDVYEKYYPNYTEEQAIDLNRDINKVISEFCQKYPYK